MSIIAEVRENNERWERSIFSYIEQSLLKYATEHGIFSEQAVKELCYLINTNYSTRVSNDDLKSIAEKISTIPDIQNRLASGDIKLVDEIASGASSGHICQSFASKFCYMYNRNAFPIYDSIARIILVRWYNKRYPNKRLDPNARIDYSTYVDIYKEYQQAHDLLEFKYWELDKYFWVEGKRSSSGFARELFC